MNKLEKVIYILLTLLIGLFIYTVIGVTKTTETENSTTTTPSSKMTKLNYWTAAHTPIIGNPNASVTLVEFIDPACEACRAMYPYVKQILSKYPDDVKLVIRYVDFHKESELAIRILEAARQ